MPWNCNCGTEVPDTTTHCPACGDEKTAWTLVADRTRTFTISTGKKFEVLRGVSGSDLESDDDYDLEALEPTDSAVSVPVAEARALLDANQKPSPAQVLFARLSTARNAPTVGLGVLFNTRPSDQHEAPASSLDASERRLAAFLLVHGPAEEVAAIQFPGLTVLDVTEGDPEHAPSIELTGLNQAVELPINPPGQVVVNLLYEDGTPMADAAFTAVFATAASTVAGRTSPEGRATIDLPAGAGRLRLFLGEFPESYVEGGPEVGVAFYDWMRDW